jgi:hypothetical protein
MWYDIPDRKNLSNRMLGMLPNPKVLKVRAKGPF